MTDGIGMPDIRESFRFQKVLQGQEIVGFSSPYDGIDAQNHHPSEIGRFFPGSNSSGISAIGNNVRNQLGNSDVSYNSIGFGESLRFHKVLQGQENYVTPPYGRTPTANLAYEQHGGHGILDGVQMPRSSNGFSSLIQGYNNQMGPPASSGHVSSPPSVLMFQQASSPVPNFYSRQSVISQEQQEICNQSLTDESKTYGGKVTSSFTGEQAFRRENYGSSSVPGQLKEYSQYDPLPSVTRSAFRGSQDLVVPSCKTSCKLFGFSLTEGRHVSNNEESSTLITSPLYPGTTYVPHYEKQLHPKPPIMTRAVGSNCTKGSELYAVRDMLLDIAL